jgi:hypothetical protein
VYATGESLYRPRNEARALGGLLGNERAYRTQNRGIGAGSKLSAYNAGMSADRASQDQYDAASKSDLAALADRPDARFLYQQNAADEQKSLRSLLLDRNSNQQNFDIQRSNDAIESNLQSRKIRAEQYAQRQQQKSNFLGTLLGIL